MFSSPLDNQLPQAQEKWRLYVDWFVQDYQPQLAALAWGLQKEWGDDGTILGIDLEPKPHFIPCSPAAIEKLNRRVGGRIQEIVGILKGADLSKETIILCLAKGQLKLVCFENDPGPEDCFAIHGLNLDDLIKSLETAMAEEIKLEPTS